MSGFYGQDYDDDGNIVDHEYDPVSPLAYLEKASSAAADDQVRLAVRAVRAMLEAGADEGVVTEARAYVKRTKLFDVASFDRMLKDARGSAGSQSDVASAATVLVQLAQEHYSFGVTDSGEPFAVPCGEPRIVAMLRGGKTSLRALLAREYFTRTGRAAAQQALADALLVIEGFAQEQEPSRLYLRTAQHDGELWLDLGDTSGRAVHVTAAGWTIEDSAPVLFRRTALTAPLPEPEHGSNLSKLWDFLNVCEDDRPLVAAQQVHQLFSDEPHVVTGLFGEHGTGKTTAAKILTALLDPSPALVRKAPRDAESWVTAAAGSWVVTLDNLSDMPVWLSDALCRASTGDGDVRRKLYSDGDLAVFAFLRSVIFSAIDVGALQADLASRLLALYLTVIEDDNRTEEKAFWADWQASHPDILGAVLDLASGVLRRLPDIALARKPRMADFGMVLAAVDAELGTEALTRYASQADDLAADSVSGDKFGARMLASLKTQFDGTSADLLDLVTPAEEGWKPPKEWPADARAVTGRMRRLAPALRKIGWAVSDRGRSGRPKQQRWRISPPETAQDAREDATHATDAPGAEQAEQAEQHATPSTSAWQGKPACEYHAGTPFGYRKHCRDCEALQ